MHPGRPSSGPRSLRGCVEREGGERAAKEPVGAEYLGRGRQGAFQAGEGRIKARGRDSTKVRGTGVG